LAHVNQIQINASAYQRRASEHRPNRAAKWPPNTNLLKAQEVHARQAKAKENKITGSITVELTLWSYPPAFGAVAKKVNLFNSFLLETITKKPLYRFK
jgi:hypothetical protein